MARKVSILSSLCVVLLWILCCTQALHHEQPGDRPSWGTPGTNKSADFIVVGGGTAGLTVAARLVDAGFSVLVLEAGGFPDQYGLPWKSPALTGEMTNTPLDWNFTSLPVPGLNGRAISQSRGHCLGGTSSINGLTYGRGSASIYNGWKAMGNPGWGWNDIEKYFERTWQLVLPPSTSYFRTYNSSLYSLSAGPGKLGYTNYNKPTIDAFVESLPSIGIPIAIDLNNGTNIGGKHELNTLDATTQTRVSSYIAFWHTVSGKPNFEAVTFATVEKILFLNHGSKGEPTAYGVEYSITVNGEKRIHVAHADKEVILSAGTLQTPQVLMLSGIGPRDVLDSLQIPIVYENEWVGKHLYDAPIFPLIVKTDEKASTNKFQHSMQKIKAAMKKKTPADPNSPTNPINTIDGNSGPAFAFAQLSHSQLRAADAAYLIANRSEQAHYEYILWTSLFPLPDAVPTINHYYDFTGKIKGHSYISLMTYLSVPSTSGRITINSTNASDSPVISLSYLENDSDMNICILAFKRLRKLISEERFSKFTVGPANGELVPGASVQTDEEIAAFIHNTAYTAAHHQGTAAMRPRHDEGVVSPSLEVYGVQGLRIVDASIVPLFLDQHPSAAVYMIAEKAAEVIGDKYKP